MQLSKQIRGTGSRVDLDTVKLTLSANDAYALCNLLHPDFLMNNAGGAVNSEQKKALIRIGAALGAFVEHSNAEWSESDGEQQL